MLNSYNPYNIISLDMSSKDKANDKPYVGTRIFPVSFYTTTDEGNIIPNTQLTSIEFPLLAVVGQSQNYDYSEAQLENETQLLQVTPTETTTARTGSFLVVPLLFTYCGQNGIFDWYDDPYADILTEIQNLYDYASDNGLNISTAVGDPWTQNGDQSGFVIGIAADGTLHPLALDLQPNSDNSAA